MGDRHRASRSSFWLPCPISRRTHLITSRFEYGRPRHATCPREGWSKDPEHIVAYHASENTFLDAEMTRVMG
jgi:hypothetical protein